MGRMNQMTTWQVLWKMENLFFFPQMKSQVSTHTTTFKRNLNSSWIWAVSENVFCTGFIAAGNFSFLLMLTFLMQQFVNLMKLLGYHPFAIKFFFFCVFLLRQTLPKLKAAFMFNNNVELFFFFSAKLNNWFQNTNHYLYNMNSDYNLHLKLKRKE